MSIPSPGAEAPANGFDQLGLGQPLLQALARCGYTEPTEIQLKAIPAVLSGRDLMAAAQTGTGKTAGFTLPILERLRHGAKARAGQVRALVLTPTRELAAQVADSAARYGQGLDLRSTVVFGGVGLQPQIERLRKGVDLLVATPGRLIDLHGQGITSFDRLEVLVMDEADRMLDMGFIHDIRRILSWLPSKRQNLMFSATFSGQIRKLAEGFLHQPLQLQVTPENRTADTVDQRIHPVDQGRKSALLSHLITSNDWQQVLVFSRTKHGANKLAERLTKEGIQAAAIHGNKSQGARTRALSSFKGGELRVLVATDLAARGLDIAQLPHVVNLDLPNVPEDYVHRIGRTGRAGMSGHALSLVSAEERDLLGAIEKLIGAPLPREVIPGFEPDTSLPVGPPPGARSTRPPRGGAPKRQGRRPPR